MQTEQATFKALADPTRRSILRRLSVEDLTIAEIAGGYDMTRAAVKKHLTVLSDGGLITVRASGRERYNSLNRAGFAAATSWLTWFDAFWGTALDDLKTAIEKDINHD
ncbi:MAG: ArsR/SmtB family transcription factor [Planktomarina sp.]